MKNLLTFKMFEASGNPGYRGEIEPIYAETLADFLKELKKLKLSNKWKFDEFGSLQADSKFPCIQCSNEKDESVFISLMHDDYDDSEWGIAIVNSSGETGDEVILQINNLEMMDAFQTMQKIVGKENMLVKTSKGKKSQYGTFGTIDQWLDENPLYKSKKLKTALKVGILDEHYDIKEFQNLKVFKMPTYKKNEMIEFLKNENVTDVDYLNFPLVIFKDFKQYDADKQAAIESFFNNIGAADKTEWYCCEEDYPID